MPKKIKIREIKKNIKIRELKSDEEEILESETEEPSLEDIASDAPSAREFPEFTGRAQLEQGEQAQQIQTTSATTEEESRAAVRYSVQENVSEAELQAKYESSASRMNVAQTGAHTLLPSREGHISSMFENRELAAAQSQEQEEKYEVLQDIKPKEQKKRYPWEA